MPNYHRCRPRPPKKLNRCLKTLVTLLHHHLAFSMDKKRMIGQKTRDDREEFYKSIFYTLSAEGFHLDDVKNLRLKHVQFLLDKWVDDKLSPFTVHKYLSFLRTFCVWIDKKGMIELLDLSRVPKKPTRAVGSLIEYNDWSIAEDFILNMSNILKADQRVGCQLLLMYSFGLSVTEALLFKLYEADGGQWLGVDTGKKGGKLRVVQIEYPVQRELLIYIKSFLLPSQKSKTIIPAATVAKAGKTIFTMY